SGIAKATPRPTTRMSIAPAFASIHASGYSPRRCPRSTARRSTSPVKCHSPTSSPAHSTRKRPAAMLPEDKLILWRQKPQAFVRELFGVTPDAWQDEALEAFPHSPRLAMKACKGPGKTAVLAWIAWNFLVTRLHPMIGATSSSGD